MATDVWSKSCARIDTLSQVGMCFSLRLFQLKGKWTTISCGYFEPDVFLRFVAYAQHGAAATALAFSPRVQLPPAQVAPLALPTKRGPTPAPKMAVPKQHVEALAKHLAMAAAPERPERPERRQVAVPAAAPQPAAALAARAPASPPASSVVSAVSAPAVLSTRTTRPALAPPALEVASVPTSVAEHEAPVRPSRRPPRGSECLSHATTPSWRSSKEVSVESPGSSSARCRLSPFLEKRWEAMEKRSRFAPKSELERLERIDPEVDEANAVLVESFLNVKRSLGAEVGEASSQSKSFGPSSCSASKPGAGRSLGRNGYQVLTNLPGPGPPLTARASHTQTSRASRASRASRSGPSEPVSLSAYSRNS
ncbi:unnamed protein product [Effrenium voratum]|nr:unnamed protein product [Effrenium voratum]